MARSQDNPHFLAFLLVIGTHLSLTNAIQCYNGSVTKSTKQDIFKVSPDSLTLRQCSESKLCFNFIYREETGSGQVFHGSFACDTSGKCKGQAGCSQDTYQNNNGTLCCCLSDKCNIKPPVDNNEHSTPSPTSLPPMHFTTPKDTGFRMSCITGTSQSTLMATKCTKRTKNCFYAQTKRNDTLQDKFGCDLDTVCSKYHVTNTCKEVDKNMKLCCCGEDNCNTPKFANMPIPQRNAVSKCYTGRQTTAKHDPLVVKNCSKSSMFCLNTTSNYSKENISREYSCDQERLCPATGCFHNWTVTPVRTVCCCTTPSCNVPTRDLWVRDTGEKEQPPQRMHTLVYILLVTVASFVTIAIFVVVYKRCR